MSVSVHTLPPLPSASESLDRDVVEALQSEIRELAAVRQAVILAHNYQVPEVQEVADHIGDSLALSRQAAETDAETIVFCGVHFMAETASILSPDKTVLIPDLEAGCSLADSITADEVRTWKDRYPGAVVVMYVNTSAEVKAETDWCCTSSNAVDVVRAIPDDREILFGPDMFLGSYVERRTGRPMKVWPGECHVHAGIRPRQLTDLFEREPDAELLIHPECGCTTSAMYYMASGDAKGKACHMLSTSGMIERARSSPAEKFVVATETGILHQMRQQAPDKEFIAANPQAVCPYMKAITLTKVRDSLRDTKYEIKVEPQLADRARLPIERMIAIG